ncbi:MAG: uroporphyrinogen-III synthase [Bernardetiaceae bacterium]|jgi:uroporphyrinogen-III synthase|nr:uroporphyrinogen-III synthase [Bernardetiaceae bacterium]
MQLLSTKILRANSLARLQAAGATVRQVAFIGIEYLPLAQTDGLDNGWPFAFTSQHGLLGLAANGFAPPHKQCYCMDGPTAELAENQGWQVLGVGQNAEELAQVLTAQQVPHLHFVGGNLRLPTLPTRLRARAVEVREWVVYQTHLLPQTIEPPPQGVLFFSPSAVRAFLAANPAPPVAFCLGLTSRQALPSHFAGQVVIAPRSVETALIDTVADWLADPNRI